MIRQFKSKVSTAFKLDTLFLILICFYTYKIVSRLKLLEDLPLWDEVNYLSKGTQLDLKELTLAPLYRIWYYLLYQIQKDPAELYYLNFSILLFSLPLLAYSLCRKLDAKISLATLAAILSIHLPIYFHETKVNLFATIIILLGLNLSFFLIDKKRGLAIILSLFLASLVRAEFILSFIIFLIFMAKNQIKAAFRIKPKTTIIFASSLFILSLSIFNLKRPAIAFRQGFSVNYYKSHQLEGNAWINYSKISKKVFNNEHVTTFEALFSNHKEWFNNFLINLKNYFLYSNRDLIPNFGLNHTFKLLLSLFLLTYILINLKNQVSIKNQNHKYFICLISILLATLTSSLFIFTLPRYLNAQHVCLLILASLAIDTKKIETLLVTIIAVILVVFAPFNTSSPRPNYELIQELNSYNLSSPLAVFENLGGICRYLDPSCKFYWLENKTSEQNFEQFINSNKINAIIINSELESDPRLKADRYWQDLLNQDKYFRQIKLKQGELRLLIKNN